MADELNKIEYKNWTPLPIRKPGKLLIKAKMQQSVIDEHGQLFDYTFENGKLEYIFKGLVQLHTATIDVK